MPPLSPSTAVEIPLASADESPPSRPREREPETGSVPLREGLGLVPPVALLLPVSLPVATLGDGAAVADADADADADTDRPPLPNPLPLRSVAAKEFETLRRLPPTPDPPAPLEDEGSAPDPRNAALRMRIASRRGEACCRLELCSELCRGSSCELDSEHRVREDGDAVPVPAPAPGVSDAASELGRRFQTTHQPRLVLQLCSMSVDVGPVDGRVEPKMLRICVCTLRASILVHGSLQEPLFWPCATAGE